MTNPVGAITAGGGPVAAVLHRVKSLVDVGFWTQTALPAAAGFFGSRAVGNLVMTGLDKVGLTGKLPDVAQPFVRITADAIGGAALSWAVGRFVGKKQGDMVWLGTIVNVAYSLLRQVLGGTDIGRAIGLSGMGDDLAERMKAAVAQRVAQDLQGLGHYMTADDIRRQMMGEYVTDRALRGNSEYSASPSADLRDYDVARTETSL